MGGKPLITDHKLIENTVPRRRRTFDGGNHTSRFHLANQVQCLLLECHQTVRSYQRGLKKGRQQVPHVDQNNQYHAPKDLSRRTKPGEDGSDREREREGGGGRQRGFSSIKESTADWTLETSTNARWSLQNRIHYKYNLLCPDTEGRGGGEQDPIGAADRILSGTKRKREVQARHPKIYYK